MLNVRCLYKSLNLHMSESNINVCLLSFNTEQKVCKITTLGRTMRSIMLQGKVYQERGCGSEVLRFSLQHK